MNKGIPSLTGIRGVGALWVVFFHMQEAAKTEPRLCWLSNIQLVREGYFGVDLFFVLSGFILMYVHQNDFSELRWNETRRYFAARFWRVYPLNAVVLLLIIALTGALPEFNNPAYLTAAGLTQSFALAQRWFMPDFGSINGPSWSLSVEVLGYAAFPLIAYALNRVKSRHAHLLVAVASLTLLVVAGIWFGFATHNAIGRVAVVRMLPNFTAGMALAAFFAASRTSGRGWAWQSRGALATVSFAMAVSACYVTELPILVVFPFAGLVLGLAFEQGPVNRLMASTPIVWLGKISFSLYLTHYIVLGLVVWASAGARRTPGMIADGAYTMAVLFVLVGVAAGVYYLFERPLAQMSRDFLKGDSRRVARPADRSVLIPRVQATGMPVSSASMIGE